ncbi:MAG: fumarate hydratase [Oscillospiraceae bacterium]|nr:fumarate hydratase [Oscillospiraceae bacterium]
MKKIHVSDITQAVESLCIEANIVLGEDIRRSLREAIPKEDRALSKEVLKKLLENADIAYEEQIPICQDTGLAVVFVELGQEVYIEGGSLTEAIQRGVSQGYTRGYLRASAVADPIDRQNTGDNTPAVIHYDVQPGDRLTLTVAPKGFGSENMSALKMLTPADGLAGVERFVIETVRAAGPNPCPPLVVGVGVGGTMEKAALLAKYALTRDLGLPHGNPFWADEEQKLLTALNALGIGPAGLGGRTTALAVHIETYATHIAGLPVAVNIGCHVTRHRSATL